MANQGNGKTNGSGHGNGNGHGPPHRHLPIAAVVAAVPSQEPDGGIYAWIRRNTGTVFVVSAVGLVLALWLGLWLVFREWRREVQDRIDFGKSNVAPVLEPLAGLEPPGVDPEAWRQAVDQTESLLDETLGTGLLTEADQIALRDELGLHVTDARNHPEQAVVELAFIWDELARRKRPREATFRPRLLGPSPPAEP